MMHMFTMLSAVAVTTRGMRRRGRQPDYHTLGGGDPWDEQWKVGFPSYKRTNSIHNRMPIRYKNKEAPTQWDLDFANTLESSSPRTSISSRGGTTSHLSKQRGSRKSLTGRPEFKRKSSAPRQRSIFCCGGRPAPASQPETPKPGFSWDNYAKNQSDAHNEYKARTWTTPPVSMPIDDRYADVAAEICIRVNKIRVANGLKALKTVQNCSKKGVFKNDPNNYGCAYLRQLAKRHSDDLAAGRQRAHGTPKNYAARKNKVFKAGSEAFTENAALLDSGTPEAKLAQKVVEGWWNSPGHKKNMMRPDRTHVGVGVSYVDALGGYGFCQIFAKWT